MSGLFASKRKMAFFILAGVFAIATVVWVSIRPSHDREWSPDQAVLPYADISGNTVTIHNIRNFTYASTTSYAIDYYDKTFDISKLKKAYFIVEPFSGYVGAAHTFLSFEFEGNDFVSISVEIRKEKGESFSAVKGLLKQFELMYVVADERDVVKLRSNYRKDNVYVYPIKGDKEKIKAVFLDMIARVNSIKERPEFYNTVFSNCTNNIVEHVNRISPNRIPWDTTFIMPANSDEYAFELGLIDTNAKTIDEARKLYLINERAEKYADSPDFSLKIRGR